METTFIPPASASVSASSPTTRSFSDLRSEDFFKLLIAELQSQDPMNPTDNQALLDQMSSIRQMEQSTTLNTTLQALAGEQRFGATAALIGQYVTGEVTDSGGNVVDVSGIVTAVRFQRDGSAVLELHNGKVLPADKVTFVTLLENLPAEELLRLQTELGLNGSDAAGAPAGGPSTDDETGSPAAEAAKARNSRFNFGDPQSGQLDLGQLLGFKPQPARTAQDDFWRTLLGLGK